MSRSFSHATARSLFAALCLCTLLNAGGLGKARAAEPALPEAGAEIRWDQWGVPHIKGASAEDAFYAMGWAQMRGRPDLVLKLLGQGRGRAAEYWGEDFLESDTQLWTLGLPQSLDALYDAQGPVFAARLEAFAKGINDYAAAHPERIDDAMERALPITGKDVLGHVNRVFYLVFVAQGPYARFQAFLNAQTKAQSDQTGDAEERGSNAWAIGPSRSQSGKALLLSNPHLPWRDLFLFYEAHVTAPDMNAYGVTLIGVPMVAIAFNEHVGWTHTVNTYDGADVFAFDLAEGGYRIGGETKAFETQTVALTLREPDGTLTDRPLTIARTDAGPVIARTDDKAYAMRIAGFADPSRARLAEQYWDMAGATTLDEFEAAMAKLQSPMFNTVYADRHGDIFYLFNALAPKRARGNARLWSGVVDGSDPAMIWTDYHSYDALPKIKNAPSGFVQNANETPWTATLPPVLDPAAYPADLVPPLMRARPQSSLSLLLSDKSISFDEAVTYSGSTRLVSADNLLPDLLKLARLFATETGSSLLAEAVDVLENWDRTARADSRGAVLFDTFMELYLEGGQPYETPWSFETPATWPTGLARPEEAITALKAAAARLKTEFRALGVPWKRVYRIDYQGADLPVDLGIGGLGAFKVGNWTKKANGKYTLTGGTTYVAVTEFGDEVRAKAILPYGNFEKRPDWVKDQLVLLSEGGMRTVNFSEEAVAAATVDTERLTPDLE